MSEINDGSGSLSAEEKVTEVGVSMHHTRSRYLLAQNIGDLEPIGDPARDVANFYQKLLHSAARNGVPNRDALALGASFLQTYEQEEGIPLRPAAFQFARARTALGEFLRACHTVDEPALIEQHLELVSSVLWERTL